MGKAIKALLPVLEVYILSWMISKVFSSTRIGIISFIVLFVIFYFIKGTKPYGWAIVVALFTFEHGLWVAIVNGVIVFIVRAYLSKVST